MKIHFNINTMNLMMGLIVFSPLSSLITMNFLHLPLSLPELLFIPFLKFFKRTWYCDRLNVKTVIALLLLWIFILACSLINGIYSFKEILGAGRTYLYIFFFIALFSNEKKLNLENLYFLSIGALIGWSIDAILNLINLTNGELSISYGPMIAIPIAIGYPFLKRMGKRSVLIFLWCVIIGIVSMLRRVIVIAIFDLLIYYIWKALQSIKGLIKLIVTFITISIIGLCSYPFIRDYIKEYNHDMYVRIIEKSEGIFNGNGNTGDDSRTLMMTSYINSLHTNIIPHGFVSKNFNNGADGSYNDLPLKEISHTFSIPLSLLLIFILGVNIFNIRRCIRLQKVNQINFIICVGLYTEMVLLMLEGSFLTFPYQSIFTGFYIGASFNGIFKMKSRRLKEKYRLERSKIYV